jgi:acetolactate synthase-1/2/3 large subunit
VLTGPVMALADLIRAAINPVIIAGYGCIKADARQQVARLSELEGIPVTTSLKGKGVVSEGSELSLGCLGVTSNGDAKRYVVEQADLLIFLGAGFNERTSYLWDDALLEGKKIAQIDRDTSQIGRVFNPDLAIPGDIREVLTLLLEQLDDQPSPVGGEATVEDSASGGDASLPPVGDSRFELIERFYHLLAEYFPENAIVFDDNIVFAQTYYRVSSSNHYFPNSGISSLGHAIPAAIGARFHAGDSPTFAVLGDGGFQMCCMEIMTAVNYGIPLNIVVINNGTMGLIRKNQFQLYGKRYIDCDFANPDFEWLARSFGISHRRIARVSDIDELFATADLSQSINLIEIMLDKHAFPTYLSSR